MRPPFSGLEDSAAELEAFGALEGARALREAVTRARTELEAWWNTPLTLADAGAWGGYSESQLRRLIRERKVPTSRCGGIRRRDVPVHPGHRLPLGLEPAAVASGGFVANILDHRQIGKAS